MRFLTNLAAVSVLTVFGLSVAHGQSASRGTTAAERMRAYEEGVRKQLEDTRARLKASGQMTPDGKYLPAQPPSVEDVTAAEERRAAYRAAKSAREFDRAEMIGRALQRIQSQRQQSSTSTSRVRALLRNSREESPSDYEYEHIDGRGHTERYGDTVTSHRDNGLVQSRRRVGNWEFYQDNTGTSGRTHYGLYGKHQAYINPQDGSVKRGYTRYGGGSDYQSLLYPHGAGFWGYEGSPWELDRLQDYQRGIREYRDYGAASDYYPGR
jgi:hypothetical protein